MYSSAGKQSVPVLYTVRKTINFAVRLGGYVLYNVHNNDFATLFVGIKVIKIKLEPLMKQQSFGRKTASLEIYTSYERPLIFGTR